jgi:hypothetical protein
MNLFRKRDTDEIKSRKRRFLAFCLTLLTGLLPTVTVLAANINFGFLPSHNLANHIGDEISAGETITWGSGTLEVTYEPCSVTDRDMMADNERTYSVKSISGYDKWKITSQRYADNILSLTLSAPDKSSSGSNKKRSHTPGSWEGNPDEISAFYIKNGVMDPKAKFGKQEQGAACKAAFAAALPAGFTQAFTFSMSVDDKHTTDLKDGSLKLYVPSYYQKTGRQYAIMAIDKNGLVHIYNDSDTFPFIVTAQLNFEGYAFALIYKD